MKSTTGAVDTALSIADFVSFDSRRAWRKDGPWKDGARKAGVCGFKKFAGRDRGRNAWMEHSVSLDFSKPQKTPNGEHSQMRILFSRTYLLCW